MMVDQDWQWYDEEEAVTFIILLIPIATFV